MAITRRFDSFGCGVKKRAHDGGIKRHEEKKGDQIRSFRSTARSTCNNGNEPKRNLAVIPFFSMHIPFFFYLSFRAS